MTSVQPSPLLVTPSGPVLQIADRYAAPPSPGGGAVPQWWSQSLAHGAVGITLLHIECAASGIRDWSRVRTWLRYITSHEISVGPNASLYFGAPAVEFVVRAASPHMPALAVHTLPELQRRTDAILRRRLNAARWRLRSGARPPLAEFDTIRGLAGFGRLLLHRDAGCPILAEVLRHLVALTKPLNRHDREHALPGWWTDSAPNGQPSDAFAHGHANNGMAHGIGGVLALLSLALRRGVAVDGTAEAIERIVAWLDSWKQVGESGPWWPYWITADQVHGAPTNPVRGPGRPSWCYGTLGLARAQQLAAIALQNPERRSAAEAAAVAGLNDPAQTGQVKDASLCHGYAGVLHIAALMAADSPTPGALADLVPGLFGELIRMLSRQTESTDPGWLEGEAGIALAVHALNVRPFTGWDQALLIS